MSTISDKAMTALRDMASDEFVAKVEALVESGWVWCWEDNGRDMALVGDLGQVSVIVYPPTGQPGDSPLWDFEHADRLL